MGYAGRQIKRIFYGQADRKRFPLPSPCGQLFVKFLCVFFILDYEYLCSETDFTLLEKVNFHATTGILNFSSYCCCPPDDHLQEAGPSF